MSGKLRTAALLGALLVLGGCNGEISDPAAEAEVETGNGASADDELARTPVPDCYAEAGLSVAPPQPERALFVMVDQTTGLDDRLRRTVRSNAQRLLHPGTSFTVSTFSAFSRGNYATVIETAASQAPVPEAEQGGLPVRRVEALNACLSRQRDIVAAHLGAALDQAVDANASTFTNSDIMASLSQLSEAVVAAPGGEKLVILVSDLLEHSSTTSFYRNRQIRGIDPAAEIAKAEANRLFGQFDGARVAIVGAAMLAPESGEDATRDSAALGALREFWSEWLSRSGAQLIAYGQPDLVAPIQWNRAPARSD